MSQFWPSCISGTSHAPCREVPSALLPVCSAVSPAYKNFSCSPSFFSSSFHFSFLVFRLVHQSKSQVSSQVRSRLPNQLGLSSALPLPCHMTVADKSSPSASISATRHWSFFFARPSAPSRTFRFRDTQACSSVSCSTRASRLASSAARSSRRLSWVMFSDSQESDTQDFPRRVHSAHFNLSLLSDIRKQGLRFKAQKSHGASDRKL